MRIKEHRIKKSFQTFPNMKCIETKCFKPIKYTLIVLRLIFTVFIIRNISLLQEHVQEDLSKDNTTFEKESFRTIIYVSTVLTIIFEIIFTLFFTWIVFRQRFPALVVMVTLCLVAFLFDIGYDPSFSSLTRIVELILGILVIVLGYSFATILNSVYSQSEQGVIRL